MSNDIEKWLAEGNKITKIPSVKPKSSDLFSRHIGKTNSNGIRN